MAEQRKYRAKAVPGTAVIGTSAKKGTPQISVELELVDTGERMTWTGYFSDAANQYTVKNMRTLGFRGDDVDDLSSIDGSVEVDLVVEDEEYNGRLYPRIKFINAIGGGGASMPDAARKAFAARMKGIFRAVDAQDGAAPAAPKAAAKNPARQPTRQPAPPPADAPSDDIPF